MSSIVHEVTGVAGCASLGNKHRRPCQCTAPVRGQRLMVRRGGTVAHAQARGRELSPSPSVRTPRHLTLLPSLSRAVEVEGLTTQFETLAGRSAMLGALTAIVVESLTQESLLGSTRVSGELAAALVVTLVSCASALAVVRHVSSSKAYPDLLEPVITSLTAVQRVASSVTHPTSSAVDRAVDRMLVDTFTPEAIRTLASYDDLDISD